MPSSLQKPNSSPSLLFSFQCALNGIWLAFQSERNLKIHAVISILVCSAALYLGFNQLEWIALVLCITLMIGTELINTAIEYVCDYVEPSNDSRMATIKDISAGACFITALGCSVVGIILFSSYCNLLTDK